jgi:hypothetical protein
MGRSARVRRARTTEEEGQTGGQKKPQRGPQRGLKEADLEADELRLFLRHVIALFVDLALLERDGRDSPDVCREWQDVELVVNLRRRCGNVSIQNISCHI